MTNRQWKGKNAKINSDKTENRITIANMETAKMMVMTRQQKMARMQGLWSSLATNCLSGFSMNSSWAKRMSRKTARKSSVIAIKVTIVSGEL